MGNSLLAVRVINHKYIVVERGVRSMKYEKPSVLAQSTVQMAECRPNSKPSGRPCNPPGPGGR